MQTNNMMLNQLIQNSSLLHNSTNSNSATNGSNQSHAEQLYDEQKSKKLFTSDLDQTEVVFANQQHNQQQFNNSHAYNPTQTQTSSSNSSTAPTPTPVHHQQQYFNSTDPNNMSKFTSPSTSPPPPHVQPYQNGSVMTNGNHRSLSKSPIRTVNGQDGICEEVGGNVERRHAEKMEYAFERAKLSLNITFDDKTSRFVESLISNTDTANKLTEELIQYGLVSEVSANHYR